MFWACSRAKSTIGPMNLNNDTRYHAWHSSALACIFPFLGITQSQSLSSLMINMTVWIIKSGGMKSNLLVNPTSHGVYEDPRSHGRGGYYNHGFKKIFPGRFLAVSLHISILLYIRTSHARGHISSFKTLDLVAFQKSDPKARKLSASKFIKEKLKKMRGRPLWRATKRNTEQLEPSNFF